MMKGDKNEAKMVSSKEGHGMDMSMNEMSEMLKDVKGNEFDKMFLEMMTSHHQGAIDMANLALVNSERKEIKDLANDIISAQEKEIEMMENWLESWW